ncbi:hypothetical protein CEUSTIGMA_g5337.t1 [Chlamydomonas eustigma]|uniref:PDZ domain-containing protein n=1 Tax=Chlamydomonas eustigma TaxID=1157962 RepID=A0A250X4A1_9CHLO|nr:hypothetical protein CEUSTIGMA_g5337.t1 [Chlamydomonas eustigma]|eukprot:GAX77895.1 hypothetical protein CEUSTIGMA_g5337.t1 [Chlamydomonas eustigma]
MLSAKLSQSRPPAFFALKQKQVSHHVCQASKITLRMPIGVVFEQKAPGEPVIVGEVMPGGAAEKSGRVTQGDILTACSAVILKAGKEGQFENEGYGQRPYDNWERVTFDCRGQEFKTVMSALKSNNPRWGFNDVILEFEKPSFANP